MDENSEKSQECSLKIDTIWSEADENILVKEEIVSDLEAEGVGSFQENSNSCVEPSETVPEEGGGCNGYAPEPIAIPTWQSLKKKAKSRAQRSDEAEILIQNKLTCLHDTKNFKIVKRRLRCGDCKSLVCPECCKVMIPNLQSHFLGSGLSNCGTFSCKLCGIIFHSLCALQAHIRVHTMDTPYVCPDCGLIYNNIYFLILHLLNKCYHVYKIVRYKCKHCTGAYFTPETFVRHIQETHIHCVFRCLYCSSLFNNYEEFNYHMENLHQKQKIQYLNYFRCSLCSNMVIPRFMYQRHIAQHRENSEFYEVDYQCLCGEIYSLIGAFRSHFTYCSKKGALPPRWSFLQRKLRTQDVLHQELFHNKEVIIRSSPISSTAEADHSMSLIKSVYSNVEVKTTKGEVGKNSSGEVGAGLEVSRRMWKKQNEHAGEESGASCNFKNLINSVPLVESRAQESGEESSGQQQPTASEAIAPEVESSNESQMEVHTPEASNSEGVHSSNSNVELEQPEEEMQKIYDHIPCDHLGYVSKTQCPEPAKKSVQEEVVAERSYTPKKYKLITELDEKTGIISTRTVPAEEGMEAKETSVNDSDGAKMLDSSNFSTPPKSYSSEKPAFKVGSSFSCPFCMVLFPKHGLTFQKFTLHLESYHPDVAINITVSKEEEAPERAEEGEGRRSPAEVCGEEATRANGQSPRSPRHEEFRELSPDEDQNTSSRSPVLVIAEELSNEDGKPRGEEGKEPLEGCGYDKPSEQPGSRNETDQSWGEDDFKATSHTDISSSPKEFDSEKKKEEGNSVEREGTKEKEKGYESGEEEGEEMEKGFLGDAGEKKTFSEYEYEGETSKDSNWSANSTKDSRGSFPDESRTEEKERSRRESEVWSEFYESLMLAEKFKKKKKESPEDEGKKKSVVSDYSAKRVVKKPKRYRESSESVDSNDYSDSDEEFLLTNDLMSKIYSEDNGDAEEQLNKKQLLLNKLENFDGRFVDYLFDVVTKKEKLFELYKKHSTLRANRYSHDLRSYRKKVLNGIKQRGRPLKILRYHELLKKKELFDDRSNKEVPQLRKKRELSPDSKANEKKRGRPRKFNEPAKLKERRRSDKEVDFIEKNFEREENDFSPSKRKRKLSSKLQYYKKISDEKEDFSSGQVITNKLSDPSRKYTCAVCKEVFPVYAELREHIVVHRMEENTFQCLECGECFVVRPSLEKHLHAFHKIKNTDKYITENECCSIKKEAVEPEDEPLKENQCKVCKDQFERAIDLTKHFRIHGMAFLKEFKKESRSTEKRSG